jgi:hypothetical protein
MAVELPYYYDKHDNCLVVWKDSKNLGFASAVLLSKKI